MFAGSVYIDKHLASRYTHAVNDEAAINIEQKINKIFKGSKHPYFNRKPVKTRHAVDIEGDTLFKLG